MPLSNVRGIISAEQEFLNFFKLVQAAANDLDRVFFIGNQECHDLVLDDMYLAEMCGWLVPKDRADEFEEIWKTDKRSLWGSEWSEFFVFEDVEMMPDGTVEIWFDEN